MNRLSKESSPYLLQHANNPVDWFPWGEEALNKAEKENKLLIISIGYAACHWCHVMEHECFEDEEVAKFMNEHFVSIKVDREERPDIDKIYMEAVVIMQRQGGWPLNCIALPDGRPIYGGTYFPKRDWLNVLAQLANLYKNDIDKANSYGDQMADVLRRGAMLKKLENPLSLQKEDIETVVNEWLGEVDAEWGGFYAERNKFVMPVDWDLLLEVAYYTEKEAQQDAIDNNLEFHGHEALHHALKLTLNRIAQGGIYDHIGGGFARYSVDRQWQVPHFEKMLYDNAQLVSLYAKAYQFYQEPAYKKVVYQTIEFVERELTDASGAFYSALDADSEGEEGKFYCWTLQEVLDIEEEVTSKIENGLRYLFAFGLYYSLDEEGNWEHGRNVIWAKQSLATFAEQQNLPLDLLAQNFEVIRQILLAKRSKRIRPALDDKCLTSWNGLMLKALVDAYVVFREESWLTLALNNARHIWENVTDSLPRAISPEIKVGARMYRNYKNGQSSIPAFLDDYAHAIEAFLALYSVTFDETWITRAQFYLNYVIQHFYDEKSGFFYYTSNAQPEIIARKTEFTDDVIPSSCGILAHCLAKFSVLTGDLSYQKLTDQMLQNVLPKQSSAHFHQRSCRIGQQSP